MRHFSLIEQWEIESSTFLRHLLKLSKETISLSPKRSARTQRLKSRAIRSPHSSQRTKISQLSKASRSRSASSSKNSRSIRRSAKLSFLAKERMIKSSSPGTKSWGSTGMAKFHVEKEVSDRLYTQTGIPQSSSIKLTRAAPNILESQSS